MYMVRVYGIKYVCIVLLMFFISGCLYSKPEKVSVSIQLDNGSWLIPASTDIEFHDENLKYYHSNLSELRKILDDFKSASKKCDDNSLSKFKLNVGEEYFSQVLKVSEEFCEKKSYLEGKYLFEKKAKLNQLEKQKLASENELKAVDEKINQLREILGTRPSELSELKTAIEKLNNEEKKLITTYKGKFYFRDDYYNYLRRDVSVPSSMVIRDVLDIGTFRFDKKIEGFKTGRTGVYEVSIPSKSNGKNKYSYISVYEGSIDEYYPVIKRIMQIEEEKGGYIYLNVTSLDDLNRLNSDNKISSDKYALYPRAYSLLQNILEIEKKTGLGSKELLESSKYELKKTISRLDDEIKNTDLSSEKLTTFRGSNADYSLSKLYSNIDDLFIRIDQDLSSKFYNESIIGQSRLDAEGMAKIIDGTHYIVVASKLNRYTIMTWLVDIEKVEGGKKVIMLNNINSLQTSGTTLWEEFALLSNK